jgi:hypothetical protein
MFWREGTRCGSTVGTFDFDDPVGEVGIRTLGPDCCEAGLSCDDVFWESGFCGDCCGGPEAAHAADGPGGPLASVLCVCVYVCWMCMYAECESSYR